MKKTKFFIKNFILLTDTKKNDMTTVKNLAVANHQPVLHDFTYLIVVEVSTGNLTYLHKMPQYTFHN